MFGFPFITSLIVAMVTVVAFSLVINKGLATNSNNRKGMNTLNTEGKNQNCHG